MFEALQIDTLAAGGQSLDGYTVAPRRVVESVEALLQIPAPIPQGGDAGEKLRAQNRGIQQLLEEAIVVTARPAPHDGLHLDILPRKRLEAQPRQGRRIGIDVQSGTLDGGVQQQSIQFQIVFDVGFLFAFLDLVERRLCNVDVSSFDEYGHLAVEKCQQQRPYVASVNIRLSHDDDAVIAQRIH